MRGCIIRSFPPAAQAAAALSAAEPAGQAAAADQAYNATDPAIASGDAPETALVDAAGSWLETDADAVAEKPSDDSAPAAAPAPAPASASAPAAMEPEFVEEPAGDKDSGGPFSVWLRLCALIYMEVCMGVV